MSHQRILVLGASGYIGQNLIPRLTAQGHEVIAAGDTIDGWKVIALRPERQLSLLFGMKAPGLGRLAEQEDHNLP